MTNKHRSLSTERLVISLCFLAGALALLDSGFVFWGRVCLVAAPLAAVSHFFLTRYQASLPDRIRAARERETERLLEIARRETPKHLGS